MFPGPLVRCDANRAMFNLTPAIVMLCYAAVDELLAQPFFLWGLFFLSAGSVSALHGADLDRGKPVLSMVLSSLVQFQLALAELQLTVVAFLSFVLPHLFRERSTCRPQC